jgi:DNA-binding MarR family transcriptional regulator
VSEVRTSDGGNCAAIADSAAGLATNPMPGACPAGVELAGLSEGDSRLLLIGHTARFTASFLRWMDARTCDGLNYARLTLIQALHCRGPAIMRDLGTQLGVTPRNMTALVDGLEEARLVVRRPHPTDRRATLIELSPAGAREADEELEPRLSAMAEIFAGLTPAEREQFAATTSKLMQAMADRQQDC